MRTISGLSVGFRVLGFRGDSFELCLGGFGLSWGGIRALVGRIFGFRGKNLWGFAGRDSGFGGASGFRGDSGFRWGFGAFVGKDLGLRERFYESKSKASGSPLKTNRFCESNRFYEIGQQGSPIKEGVGLGAELRWRTLNPKP